jgi:hypothetical protein
MWSYLIQHVERLLNCSFDFLIKKVRCEVDTRWGREFLYVLERLMLVLRHALSDHLNRDVGGPSDVGLFLVEACLN